MTQEEKEKKEENRWFESVQNKFKKLIADLRWDSLSLTETEMSIITFIMNAKSADELPILINERLTDGIIEKIKNQFKKLSVKGL